MNSLIPPSVLYRQRFFGQGTKNSYLRQPWATFVFLLGSPIPWFFSSLFVVVYLSPLATILTISVLATLIPLYILTRVLAENREVKRWRIGGDFYLFSLIVILLISNQGTGHWLETLFNLIPFVWIPLLYIIVYGWLLFPGLSRPFVLISLSIICLCILGLFEHFGLIRMGSPSYENLSTYPSIKLFFTSSTLTGVFFTLVTAFFITRSLIYRSTPGSSIRYIMNFTLLFSLSILVTLTFDIILLVILCFVVILTSLFSWPKWSDLIMTLLTILSPSILLYFTLNPELLDIFILKYTEKMELQRDTMLTHLDVWKESFWFGSLNIQSPFNANLYFWLLARSGIFGLTVFLLWAGHTLFNGFRTFYTIPHFHQNHRSLFLGAWLGLFAFLVLGLFYNPFSDFQITTLFALIVGTFLYIEDQYDCSFVADDEAL